MYYGNIKKYDIADGLGVRVSLFVSGCTNHCKGCFQSETWDFHYGKPFTEETEKEILDALNHEYIQGFTVLGGEPFEPENQRVLVQLLKKIRETYPDKDIWSYTGFVYDQDLLAGQRKHTEVTDEMLSYIDVLVDGPFVLEKKNIALSFRGSENQRVIDLKKTRAQGQIVLYDVRR
ncbi:MAG: anaerobic ribonucleoside-triphosphate reductase activating protein [Solobacterium sp.]|jgi:anaerobic ribonucleoside-triphosphate reductase activating protein|nr:anaerobic ribonucleoside-triphosphate reductase activating protein [Solobacterium sp.]MCH4047908.1 anaerobic ribonucleoside-triphosphate reductase activating protein [Solobacterium sp.]MCH4075506.1 anaerobic ribonucleoside-triphosphate reductase activating protein [Solobacterium sp.]